MLDHVRSFTELTPEEQPLAGGKGGTLAQLYQLGYPVPDGFVVLPSGFAGDELTTEAWAQVREHLTRLRGENPGIAFAVRSSALSEDSASASFAGELETVLNVRTDDDIEEAIRIVRKSRKGEWVGVYSQARGDPAAMPLEERGVARVSGESGCHRPSSRR